MTIKSHINQAYLRYLTKWCILCYNTLMQNKTYKNLIAVGFAAFVLVFATHAHAAITSDDDFHPDYTIYGSSVVSNSPQYSVYNKQSTQKSTSTNNSSNSNSSANSSSSNSDTNKVAGTSATGATVTANGLATNNLPALSMYGTNSFMPDTVFEWFFTIILILVLIIIIRIYIRSNNKGHGHH